MFQKPDGSVDWVEVLTALAAAGAGVGAGFAVAKARGPAPTAAELDAARRDVESSHAALGAAQADQERARSEARAAVADRDAARTALATAQAAQQAAQAALGGAQAAARAAAQADLDAARRRAEAAEAAAAEAARRAQLADAAAASATEAAEASRAAAARQTSARVRAGLARVGDLAVRRAALQQEIAALGSNPGAVPALRGVGLAGIRTLMATAPHAHRVLRWRVAEGGFEPFTDTPISEQLAARIAEALRRLSAAPGDRVVTEPDLIEAERLLRITAAQARWDVVASLLRMRQSVDDLDGSAEEIRQRLAERREELAAVEREYAAAVTAAAGDGPAPPAPPGAGPGLFAGAAVKPARGVAGGAFDGAVAARRALVASAGALSADLGAMARAAATSYLGLDPASRAAVWASLRRAAPVDMPSARAGLERAVALWMRGGDPGAPDGWAFYRAVTAVASSAPHRGPAAPPAPRMAVVGRQPW